MSITSFLGGSLPAIAPAIAATGIAQVSNPSFSDGLAATSPLSLGDFDFIGHAIPESLKYGVGQKLQIHEFIGGGRQVDAMGSCPKDISWRGLLLGQTAQDSRRQLEGMVDGRAKVLAWGANDISVVVQDIDFEEKGPFEIEYDIKVVVLSVAPVGGGEPGLASVASRDVAAAAKSAPAVVATQVKEAQGLLRTAQRIQAGTEQATAIASRLMAIKGRVERVVTTGQATLSGLSNIGSGGALATISRLNNASSALTSVTQAANVNAYLSRAVSNLNFGRR